MIRRVWKYAAGYSCLVIVVAATILETLREGVESFPMTILRRSKHAPESTEILKKVIEAMEKSGVVF